MKDIPLKFEYVLQTLRYYAEQRETCMYNARTRYPQRKTFWVYLARVNQRNLTMVRKKYAAHMGRTNAV